jgi:hypothetical protein
MIALLVALPRTNSHVPMRHNGAGSSAMTMSSAAAVPAARKLTIQHVTNGCHVWSNGSTTAPTMRLALTPGGKLSILDQDVDAHQLVQLAGPARLHLGGPMMANHGTSLVFARKGVYRFKTRTVEMPGMEMEAKTVGPDNTLRLLVSVA